jgi:hypothetical protein
MAAFRVEAKDCCLSYARDRAPLYVATTQRAELMQKWLDSKQASGLKVPPQPAGGGYYIYIPGSAAKAAKH